MRDNLESMLDSGRDDALLRFTLGELCLKDGEPETAAKHLSKAVEYDPEYSAAWKFYGRALSEVGEIEGARMAFDRGIEVAERRGDHQAAKEMKVHRKRLDKQGRG